MSISRQLLRAGGVAAGLVLAALQVQAQTAGAGSGRGFVGLGITGGGEKLVTVQWADGDTTNIKSGGMVDLRVGYDSRTPGATSSWQLSVGYFTDAANGKNGSVRFDRVPVELIGYWHPSEQMRLGLGVRYATGAKLRSSGAATLGNVPEFKARPGALIEAEFGIGANASVAVRVVAEKYKIDGGTSVSGNHGGVRMNYYF